jgi:hypothetical protein
MAHRLESDVVRRDHEAERRIDTYVLKHFRRKSRGRRSGSSLADGISPQLGTYLPIRFHNWKESIRPPSDLQRRRARKDYAGGLIDRQVIWALQREPHERSYVARRNDEHSTCWRDGPAPVSKIVDFRGDS